MKTRTRKPRAQRRAEIAQAVLRIIGERGLRSLTTATIAEEVGVTSGALFRHFASLDEMLVATVHHGIGRIETTFPNESLPALDRLIELARNRIRVLGSDPGLAWLLRSDQALLTLPEEAVGFLREIVERSKGFIRRTLAEGVAEGSIRCDIEPPVLMVLFMGTVHTLIGMEGIHRVAQGASLPSVEQTLAALLLLLRPPQPVRPSGGSLFT